MGFYYTVGSENIRHRYQASGGLPLAQLNIVVPLHMWNMELQSNKQMSQQSLTM